LLQTNLIQFVFHGFQQNTVHCIILELLAVTSIATFASYPMCSV